MVDDGESTLLLVAVALVTLAFVVACVFLTERQVTPLRYREQRLPEFSTSVVLGGPTTTTVVDGTTTGYECDAKTLRKCRTDDATTVFGCRGMTARCHHFDRDTKYYERGVPTVIPKNATPDEGYALSITTKPADLCNPFHGDPVLVSTTPGEYVLGCQCKNPGYVGSENVLDSCTSLHICGGKVDTLDKPLAEIECVCDVTETPFRYADGLPSCKPLTVVEANARFDDWSHIVPWRTDRLIEARAYNSTVRDNMRTSRLLDPCTNSLTDVTQRIPGAYYDAILKTCAYKDYGLPVRTGVLDRTSAADSQTLDGALHTGRYDYLRIVDNVGGKRKLVNVRTELDLDLIDGGPGKGVRTRVNVNLPAPMGVGGQSQLWITTADQMLGGSCEGHWPHYRCAVLEYFDRNVYGVPTAGYRPPPGAFLWATDAWDTAERMVSSGVKVLKSGVTLDNTYLDTAGDKLRYYGVKYCHKDAENCKNGLLAFENIEDYKLHHSVLT